MGKFGDFFKKVWTGIKKGATKVWDFGKGAVQKIGHLLRPAADIAGKVGGFLSMLPGKAGKFGKLFESGGKAVKTITDMLPESQAKTKIQDALDKGIDTGQRYIKQGTEKLTQFSDKVHPWRDSGTRIARTIADGTDRLYARMPAQLPMFN